MEMAYILEPGAAFGGWKIVRPLGRGGMAEVYEVEDARLGTRYALKLFTGAAGDSAAVRARFIEEAKLLARLDHPRLVRVFDYGEAAGRPYYVMDLVLDAEGRPRTLADVGAGVDEEQIAVWYEDLREGLAYIHGKGVLHRDLKLQNVLVGPDGHAVLTDFGVAKVFDADLRSSLGMTREQTLARLRDGRRLVMGSVGYMAPELEMGVAASRESDWYALGVIVFRLLTGTWCEARTDVASALETYDPVWSEILPKLLHLNPAGRACPSYAALARARANAREVAAERAGDALRGEMRALRRTRNLGWAVAVLGILLAAGFGFGLWQTGPDFDDVVKIPALPPNPGTTEDDENPLDAYRKALVCAWELVHQDVRNLRGRPKELANKLRDYVRKVEEDRVGWPEYMEGFADALDEDESRALKDILEQAAERLDPCAGEKVD